MLGAVLFFDPLSRATLRLIALANVALLVSLVLTVALAAGPARAQSGTVCTGANLLDEIRRSDVATLAEIEAKADAVVNGRGSLWTVEKEGVAPSHLFGTMHVTDPRVIALAPEAQSAFDASATVVIETTDVLDPATMMAAMTKRPDLMMFTDGASLFSLLEPETEAEVREALQARGIPPASVQKMKPWMLAAAIALPACEMARKSAGLPFLDIKLAEDAKADGKEIAGLESMIDQLEAMASLPMNFHVDGLVATLRLGNRVDDMFETMIALYVGGEIGMLWPLFNAVLPMGDESAAAYAAFEEAMVTARNRNMAESARPFLDRGEAFIAVGALHLPGPDGLVELLRKDGYTVTRAD
jgi:uncharacterized protein YbaP (TraB family)